jgi:DNA-binding MarR family transcriptional regulator
MNKIENYLMESGYGAFLSPEDLFEIPLERFQNKSSSEINENGDFYFIIQGALDVFYPDKDGKNHLLTRVYPQDYQLGGIPKYFKRKYHNLNDYVASFSKESILYGINKDKVETLLKTPEFLEFTFEKFFNYSSHVVQENYFKSIFTLEEYLAYILYNHSTENKYTVRSYSLFANLLKCDRTNLYRALSSLQEQGVVRKEGKTIQVICEEKLRYIFEEKL